MLKATVCVLILPREVRSLWHPEYAEYMVEGTPGQPYGSLVQHFNIVEHNMSFRRSEVQSLLQPDELILSLTCFPRYSTDET